jgi:hypothetical protein
MLNISALVYPFVGNKERKYLYYLLASIHCLLHLLRIFYVLLTQKRRCFRIKPNWSSSFPFVKLNMILILGQQDAAIAHFALRCVRVPKLLNRLLTLFPTHWISITSSYMINGQFFVSKIEC